MLINDIDAKSFVKALLSEDSDILDSVADGTHVMVNPLRQVYHFAIIDYL